MGQSSANTPTSTKTKPILKRANPARRALDDMPSPISREHPAPFPLAAAAHPSGRRSQPGRRGIVPHVDKARAERGGGLPAMGPGILGRGARRAQYAAAQRRGSFPGKLVVMAAVLGLKPDRHRVKSTARATRCMCVTRYFAPHSRAVDRPRAGICVRLSSSRIPRPLPCAVFPYVSFGLLDRPGLLDRGCDQSQLTHQRGPRLQASTSKIAQATPAIRVLGG